MTQNRLLAVGILIGATLTYSLSRFPMLIEVNWERERRHLKFDNRQPETRIFDSPKPNGYGCPLPAPDAEQSPTEEIALRE
ncbi:MAG: hypothetical protein AB8B99_00105 [Phormidesmis sp.]